MPLDVFEYKKSGSCEQFSVYEHTSFNVDSFEALAFTSFTSSYFYFNDNRFFFSFSEIFEIHNDTCQQHLKLRKRRTVLIWYSTSQSVTAPPSHASGSSSENFADQRIKSRYIKSTRRCSRWLYHYSSNT